jgi:hypothetical protein
MAEVVSGALTELTNALLNILTSAKTILTDMSDDDFISQKEFRYA